MPRFSFKDLLLAITLAAVGCGLGSYADLHLKEGNERLAITVMLVGWGFIGAGIMAPFHRPWAGAIVTMAICLLLAYIGSYYR